MVPLVQPLHLTESTRDNGVDNDCDDGREGGPSVKEGKGSPDCRDRALAGCWLCRAEGEERMQMA